MSAASFLENIPQELILSEHIGYSFLTLFPENTKLVKIDDERVIHVDLFLDEISFWMITPAHRYIAHNGLLEIFAFDRPLFIQNDAMAISISFEDVLMMLPVPLKKEIIYHMDIIK